MSRIGNRPIKLNEGVSAEVKDGFIILKSTKGQISVDLPQDIEAHISDEAVALTRKNNMKLVKSLHGLKAKLIANASEGLSGGIKKILEFKGTGYRAKVESNNLVLNMGYSHEINLPIPEGLEVSVGKNTINISGIDAQLVGNFSARIREVRLPEVYKGKGIKYNYEIIKRKDGKAAQGGKG